MDSIDKDILTANLSQKVGKAVREWAAKNDVDSDVIVHVMKVKPSCYIDDCGTTHFGDLVSVTVDIHDESEEDEE